MNLETEITEIVEILKQVFPNLQYTNQKVFLEKQELRKSDIENEIIRDSILNKVCDQLSFLFVKPIIQEQLKIKDIPFGIEDIDKEKLCDQKEIKDLKKYYYNKLKILIYLTQLKDNQYQTVLDSAQGDKQSAIDKMNEWVNNIKEIIDQVKDNKYTDNKLEDILDRFTNKDQTTLELCERIANLCPGDEKPACDNGKIGILSVGKNICPSVLPKEKVTNIISNKDLIQKADQALANKQIISELLPEICIFENNEQIIYNIYSRYENQPKILILIFSIKETLELIQSIPLSLVPEINPNLSKISIKDIQKIEEIDAWLEDETRNMNEEINIYPISLQEYCNENERPNKISCDSPVISDSKIITTIGDGTCLLHAFLISVSSNYRKSTTKAKLNIGYTFRKQIFGEFENIKNSSLIGEIKNNNYTGYLSTESLEALVDIYNLNVFLFYVIQGIFGLYLFKPKEPQTSDDKYMCMFYKGEHFSSVQMMNEKFILRAPEDNEIIGQYLVIAEIYPRSSNNYTITEDENKSPIP
jgi:hypothetical protein